MEKPALYRIAPNVIAFPKVNRTRLVGGPPPPYGPEPSAEAAWEPATDEEKLEAYELLSVLQDELKEQMDLFHEMERQFQIDPQAPE